MRIRGRAQAASVQPVPAIVQAYLDGPSRPEPATEPERPRVEGGERRRCDRTAISSEVTVRRIGGFNFQVPLSNVSPSGCKVELVEEGAVGDSVIARFPRLEPLGSKICWTNGRTTGVEFLSPIHPAVFDLLVTRLSGETAAVE